MNSTQHTSEIDWNTKLAELKLRVQDLENGSSKDFDKQEENYEQSVFRLSILADKLRCLAFKDIYKKYLKVARNLPDRIEEIKKSLYFLRTKVRSLRGLLDVQSCIHLRTKVRSFLQSNFGIINKFYGDK